MSFRPVFSKSKWPHVSRLAAALCVAALLAHASAVAQVGGRGADPIPAFTQDVGGGTGPTVTFDPTPSYLPAAPTGQTYQYTLIWDFGDGSAVQTVGPCTDVAVLIPVTHTYPDVLSTYYTVTLRIDVTIVTNNVASAGPSASTTGQVHSAEVNFPPTWSLVNISSPATGQLPYQLVVDVAGSFDDDGYIIWAAIDWGDGAADLLPVLPPSKTALTYFHSYVAQGTYTVTLSLIDNGRMDPGTPLNPTPPASDPKAALQSIQTQQQTLIDAGTLSATFNDPKYLPILRQDFIQVQVPGNLMVQKGQFALDFANPNDDAFDCTFVLNGPVAAVSDAQVQVYLGSGSNNLILHQFTTDLKGNFFDQAQGLLFSVNPKKHMLRFKVSGAALQSPFQIGNGTVVNGFVDVPIKIFIIGPTATTALAAKLRFVYNARAGAVGIGKKPRSVLVGN